MKSRQTWRRGPLFIALLVVIAALIPGSQVGTARATGCTAYPCGTIAINGVTVVSNGVTVPSAIPTVAPGSTLYISGYGFNAFAGTEIYVYSNPFLPGTCGQYTNVAPIVVSADGSFPSFPITIPSGTAPESYSLAFYSSCISNALAFASVNVVTNTGSQYLTLTPATVAAYTTGQEVTLSGYNFHGLGYNVTVTSSSLGVGSGSLAETAAAVGMPDFYYTFAVPNLTAGVYSISVTEAATGATAVANLVVGSSSTTYITLSPTTQVPGGVVLVSGYGFSGSGYVTVSVPQFSITIPNIVQGAGGTFSTQFYVPANAAYYPAYQVQASDQSRSASTALGVAATPSTISLLNTPSAAAPGQVVGLTGSGFPASATVTISGLGNPVSTIASATGTISTTVTVPASQPVGTSQIFVQDSYGHTVQLMEQIGVAGISLSINTASAVPGSGVIVSGAGFAANESVTVGLATATAPPTFVANTTSTFTANASGAIAGTYTVPSVAAGSYVLLAEGASRIEASVNPFTVLAAVPTATATNTPLPTSTLPAFFPTPLPTSTPVYAPLASVSTAPTTAYFAEGYTGTAANNKRATFTENLYLYNPSTVASTVTTTYYVYDPAHNNSLTTIVKQDVLAPATTKVHSVNADAGDDRYVSIAVQATGSVRAEMVVGRVATDGTVLDSASSQGTNVPGQIWYLAEGYTGGQFQEYVTVFNPGATTANVQVQYLPTGATAPSPHAISIPARGRATINVNADSAHYLKASSHSLGVKVTADQPVVVDRAEYWGDGAGSGKFGYSLEPGIAAGSTAQYFGYLPTADGTQSFVTVLNPNASKATVTLSLRDALGHAVLIPSAVVQPLQRYTFSLPTLLPGSSATLGAVMTSSLPVVAEAVSYFNGSPQVLRHPGIAVSGSAGGPTGSVANVGPAGAIVRIVNTSVKGIHFQVWSGGSGTPALLSDSTLATRAATLITVPAGASSVMVESSGNFAAVLVNGGDEAPTAWGENFN